MLLFMSILKCKPTCALLLVATFTGVQIPECDINGLVDLGYQAVELVNRNDVIMVV